jgi:hypothetical protein
MKSVGQLIGTLSFSLYLSNVSLWLKPDYVWRGSGVSCEWCYFSLRGSYQEAIASCLHHQKWRLNWSFWIKFLLTLTWSPWVSVPSFTPLVSPSYLSLSTIFGQWPEQISSELLSKWTWKVWVMVETGSRWLRSWLSSCAIGNNLKVPASLW